MTLSMSKTLFCFLIYKVSTEVTAWTVDLPGARQYYFEKYAKNYKNDIDDTDKRFFDNIKGDSPHNIDGENIYDHNKKQYENNIYQGKEKYADGNDYVYHSYMEKKLQAVVYNGSLYLEGLRRALERYNDQLQNCSAGDLTAATAKENSNSSWLPENEKPTPAPPMTPTSLPCQRVLGASEHVRRLAELAVWSAGELHEHDHTHASDHRDADEEDKAENELLLRLAWFLDRLALLTGFEPDPEDFVTPQPTRAPTPSPTPPSFVSADEDTKAAMLVCLQRDSLVPATVRCRYPLPLPDAVRQIFNITDDPSSAPPEEASTETVPFSPSDTSSPPSSRSPELMMTAETRHLSNLLPKLTGDKVKSVHKRSADNDAMSKIIKYYFKYKVWINSKSEAGKHEKPSEFDVDNGLTAGRSVQKRSIDNKKSIRLRLPENPMQDLSNYLKHKNGVSYVRDESQAEKIILYLEKIRVNTGLTAKTNVQKFEKIKSVQKRSVGYKKKFLPRESENPMQDISFYVKTKPGTNYQSNVAQAAQVRVGLEQVFQTGNIEVARRYGANYNPAIPIVIAAGIAKSWSDV